MKYEAKKNKMYIFSKKNYCILAKGKLAPAEECEDSFRSLRRQENLKKICFLIVILKTLRIERKNKQT